MSEGPRLELQQWTSRLADLSRELDALPAGSPEANARLTAIRSHISSLSALHGRVESGLRSAPSALAQDYLLLLGSSRSALTFLNSHRSDPGSEGYQAEATLIGELQARRDRSVASLRTLVADRMIPSLRVPEGEPSPQQVSDYRTVQQINLVLFEVTNELTPLPSGLADSYSNYIHPDATGAGAELPDWMRSAFFRELNPHPAVTGTPPAEGSPDAEFPEGHPLRDLYTLLYHHRGESFSDTDSNRAILQFQALRNELQEGGRYGAYLSSVDRFSLNHSLERLEGMLRESPHRIDEGEFPGIRRLFHRVGALDYRAQLTGAHATSARGRIDIFFHLYQEYGRVGDAEAQRGCLYDIYQLSQMGLLPENRTNGLSDADRRAILLRVAEAYVGTGRLDTNFSSIANALGREVTRLWNQGTEDSRFSALSLWTQYGRLYRDIDSNFTPGTINALGLDSPRRLLGITSSTGLNPILEEMEASARHSADPSRGAARLISLAQTYAMLGDSQTCSAILRSVEESFAANPRAGGNAFAARYLILSSFSNAGLADALSTQLDGWLRADRAALAEAGPRERASQLAETLQDWAALMSGLNEVGQDAMASRVFTAINAELAPLTAESRARVYMELLPHTSGPRREEILNQVRDLLAEEDVPVAARIQLNRILGTFSTNLFEIQASMSALTSITNYETTTPEQRLEIQEFRLSLRNHLDDLVRNDPQRFVADSDVHQIYVWLDQPAASGGGGSNGILDDLRTARQAVVDRLPSVHDAAERRRLLSLLNDSFQEGMRMRRHGNDYGLTELLNQHIAMIRSLPVSERATVFSEALQFVNQMEAERSRAAGRSTVSLHTVYFDTLTAAVPSLVSDIPAGPARRSAILQLTRSLSQVRETEERRLRSAETALATIRATPAYRYAVEHGFGDRYIGSTEAEAVDGLRPTVEAMRALEVGLWNQFAEGETIPEARTAYAGFANAMRLTVEGHPAEARAAMTAYYSDPQVRAFLSSDAAGDSARLEAQQQVQQLLDVSESILNNVAESRFDRTLRVVRGLARLRLHTLRAAGEEYPYDIGSIDRMTMELPRFLATLPPDRQPQTFEAALQLFAASDENSARLVREYNGAINRIPLQHVGSDGDARTGSVWGLIRAMEHVSEPGGAARAFAALQSVVVDDREWEWDSTEGRGDLGPALQDCCDILLEEGADMTPELRQSIATYRARIPEEEEEGQFLRDNVNWTLAVDLGLMALSGGAGGIARAAFSRMVMGLAEEAALRMASSTAIRMTMMAGRGIAYVGGHVVSGITFNLVHSATSALVLNRPFENPFSSGLRMSADSILNDPISMMLFSAIPGPSSMAGRFLYRTVATAITFQVAQNIRFHGEAAARELLGTSYHRALERREQARQMYERTHDEYYSRELERAERDVHELIGQEPDNSVRGIMHNIAMNLGQAGADHVMGTHHWAGHLGIEAAEHGTEGHAEPLTPEERAARREHHLSLADALANARDTRRGTDRGAAGVYRADASEGPARAAAARVSAEERTFFRELVDLEVFDHYAPETVDRIAGLVAQHFDPSGRPPALNEAGRRFLRFFFTRVNPEHAGRVGPEGLATILQAVASRHTEITRPVEGAPARPAEPAARGEETGGVVGTEGRGDVDRSLPEDHYRRDIFRNLAPEELPMRTIEPIDELALTLLRDGELGDTMAHIDDLLRLADPAALRTPEGRARFLREYREAHRLLRDHPERLGGLRPHDAVVALMARRGGEDLPTAARRLVSGELRLRAPTARERRDAIPAATHPDSPLHGVIVEELNASHHEATLRELTRAIEHTREEMSALEGRLRDRSSDPQIAALRTALGERRVRLETLRRRLTEARELVRSLGNAERELRGRRVTPERRRELEADARRLRSQIVTRFEALRSSGREISRAVAVARTFEAMLTRAMENTGGERTGVRVEAGEEGARTSEVGTRTPEANARSTEAEGPELEFVDEETTVELNGEEAAMLEASPVPPAAIPPTASAARTVNRMSTGILAALGIGAAATLAPATGHAQEATPGTAHAAGGVLADVSAFLTTIGHSPAATAGTLAVVALGFGAYHAVRRMMARSRAAERSASAVREGAAARNRASSSTRSEADSRGQGQSQGESSERKAEGPELPGRIASAGDMAGLETPVGPETPVAPPSPEPVVQAAGAGNEGVLQDNAPGRPRRGTIERNQPTTEYGTASARTDEGVGYKDSNEDALVQGIDASGAHYAVVLDGMGGMGNGANASRLAGEVMQRELSQHGDLVRAFQAAHAAVRREYPGSGACAVAHRVYRGADGRMRMEIVHAGDAGAAVFNRDGRLLYRSRDQSHVQMLADAGVITGGELAMRTHPDVNVVQGGLGPKHAPPPHREEILLEGGERVVMFSDGLGDNVSTEEMGQVARQGDSANAIQNTLFGQAQLRMQILDNLLPVFESLAPGERVPFTAPDGRTLYLSQDIVMSALQGETVMMNVYDAPAGGNLVDHYKPDNIGVHVYVHNPLEATTASHAEQGYPTTVVPAEGAPQPIDVPPPHLETGTVAETASMTPMASANGPALLRRPASPGEPYELHFPDLLGFQFLGTEAITGPVAIEDPTVAPRHAVLERIGPEQILVQNLDENQTFIVGPDGHTLYPVPKYGWVVRSGDQLVIGGTRVRVTASGRAPEQEAPHVFGPHPFQHTQTFAPNFATGSQAGFGTMIHPERGANGTTTGFSIESQVAGSPISVRSNPGDPHSPWRPLATGERHALNFEHGVSEEFRNQDGLVFRMTSRGSIVHVRGGPTAPELDAPGPAPAEVNLSGRDRFVIGTRPGNEIPLPAYDWSNPQALDPYLHQASSNDPNLRMAPDIPADHAQVYRTASGEWRIRNLSGAVLEITGANRRSFFLNQGAEVTLTEGQEVVFRGERPYRFRFRIPAEAGAETPLPPVSLPRIRERVTAWLDAPTPEALNQRLAAEGVPFRITAQEGSVNAETLVRALAGNPPTLPLTFENGRLNRQSAELLFAFASLPESLRSNLRRTAQLFNDLMTDLTLQENPFALHYITGAAEVFQRGLQEGLSDLATVTADFRPEQQGEAQAILARLFFWTPENMARNESLRLSGVREHDGFYMLADATAEEFPNPQERAAVQARVEAARADGRRAAAEAELIRARIQEHFVGREAPAMPPLNAAGLRGLVEELLNNAQAEAVPEAAPAAPPPPPAPPSEGAVNDPPRVGRARFRPISEITAEAERVAGGLRRGEDPNSERVQGRVARYRDHLIEQGVEAEEAQRRADQWRNSVLGAARAHQARVTHIYDTSLPARPETAHLDAATVDHHGRFANERNATEQLLDRFNAALNSVRNNSGLLEAARADQDAMAAALEGTGRAIAAATPEDVQVAAALRALNLREVTTDNLADGGWSVWIARNQARVLRDPQLRALIEEATHFEDFTAFGTTYSEATPAVRLQAALFQRYGEILSAHGVRGSDRFSPAQAVAVMGEAMRAIDGLVADPALREAQAQEFFQRVEAARAIAADRGTIAEASVRDGNTRLTFFDLRALSDFTVFQQWLALPRVTGPDGVPNSLQVSVAPMPPARRPSGEEAPRTLQIVAIPHGRALPTGRGLLSVLERMNAAERNRARELGIEPANNWFGKDSVILPNPSGGGTLLRPDEVSAILRDPALGLFEARQPETPRTEATPAPDAAEPVAGAPGGRPGEPTPAISPELAGRMESSRQRLAEAARNYRIRRSPEMTQALETLRSPEAASDPTLQQRAETLAAVFSDPRLRAAIELSEALVPTRQEGLLARDVFLAVVHGEISTVEEAVARVEGTIAPANDRVRFLASRPALERLLRARARDFVNRRLPFARDNEALRDFAVETMLARYGTELLNSPELLANLEACNRLQERFNALESGLERQRVGSHPLEIGLDSAYASLIARIIRPAERWGSPEESREEDARIGAELSRLETEISIEETRRAASEEAPAIEISDEEMVELADEADVTLVDEGAEVLDEAAPELEAAETAAAAQRNEPPPPVDGPVEVIAQAPLPPLFQEMLEQRFEAAPEREARMETARSRLPRVLTALSEALDAPIAPDSPLGQWVLSRILLHVSRSRTEPSLDAIQERVQMEVSAYRTLENIGFVPNSQVGLRLANFLVNRMIQETREVASGNPRSHVEISPEFLSGVDRLLLLQGDRSMDARERWIEWALREEQGPELLADHFWETLSGVRELRFGANGPESIDRRGQGRTADSELAEQLTSVLEELGVPSHSREGLEIATLVLARSAVDATPGHRPFSRPHLYEVLASARELAVPLRELFNAHPDLPRARRAELTLWALRNRCTVQDITGMFSLFRRNATATLPAAPEVFAWILSARPTVETLRRLRDGAYQLRRGPDGVTLTSPEGRPVDTGLGAHLFELHQDFARNFEEPVESGPSEAESEELFDWGTLGDQVRAQFDATDSAGPGWPVLDERLSTRLAPGLGLRLQLLLNDFRPTETTVDVEANATAPGRRILETYALHGEQNGPLGVMALELSSELGNQLQPGRLRRLLQTLQERPPSSLEFRAAEQQVRAMLDLADRFSTLAETVNRTTRQQLEVYSSLVQLFMSRQRGRTDTGVVGVENGLALDSQHPSFVDSEGQPASADDPGALTQIGYIASRIQSGQAVDLDTVSVTLARASDFPTLLLTLRRLYPGIRAERGSVASEHVTFRYEVSPGATVHIRVETRAAQRRAEIEAARREAAASRPSLGVIQGGRTTGKRSSLRPPAVERENVRSEQLAAVPPGAAAPSTEAAANPLNDPVRRDAFEASLVELEDSGLISAGTPLEGYALPTTQVREDGGLVVYHVMLSPNVSSVGRVPYRVVESSGGALHLVREAAHSGPEPLREIRLSAGRSRNPFRAGDRVFLLPGAHGSSGKAPAEPASETRNTVSIKAGGTRVEPRGETTSVDAPPALDPYTAARFPQFADSTSQAAWSSFPPAIQRNHLQTILTRSATSGFEFASLALEIDGQMLTTGENFLTSHSPRHVEGADHLHLLRNAVSDLELEPGISRDGTLRIYSFHTHPTRSTGSSFTRSPNSVHRDGRPFTLTNDADWTSFQGLFQASVRELRAQGWRGPIEMVAGALPAGAGPEGTTLDPTLASQPYVTVTRLRVEALPPSEPGPGSPRQDGDSSPDRAAVETEANASEHHDAETITGDSASGPELAGRVASAEPPQRFTNYPRVDPRKTQFRIPPNPLPDMERTDHRAFHAVQLINAAEAVELGPVMRQLETIASGLESVGGTEAAQYAAVAEWIRSQVAILEDPQSTAADFETAVQNLSRVVELRREFPADSLVLENFFRDRVIEIHRAAIEPRTARTETESHGTVRPPRPKQGTPPASESPSVERGTRPMRVQPAASGEAAPPVAETSGANRVSRREAWQEEADLLAEIDRNAGRQLEGFSAAAQAALAALQALEGRMPNASDPAALQNWRREHRQILENYVLARDRFARELVERHEPAGRRVLEFLQGLSGDEALWEEMEALGFERARIAEPRPSGRPKLAADVLPKIDRRGWNSLAPFTDLFGTRIIVESYEDALSVLAAVRHRFRVRPEFDRDGAPLTDGARGTRLDQERLRNVLNGRRSGYRALHVVVEVEGTPVEIQVQTRLLYRWGAIQHQFYKNEALSLPENSDLRGATDAYFAAAAAYLSDHEQGVTGMERPRRPEFPQARLDRLPETARRQISEAISAMETLLDTVPVAQRSEAPAVAEEPAASVPSLEAARRARTGRSRATSEREDPALAAVLPRDAIEILDSDLLEEEVSVQDVTAGAPNRPSVAPPESGPPSDGGNALHSSFLGAGLMMAMTMTGHDSGTSLLAGVFGTVLPVGILGILRWVRNRANPNRTPPAGPTGGRGPSSGPADQGVNANATPEAAQASPIAREVTPLEAAPPPEQARAPQPGELPLLQPNLTGGNIPELDEHLAGNTLSSDAMARVLRANTRHARLPGGSVSYLATQGIDRNHPIGEDYMGGTEYRDLHGRRVYSMMVADGVGGRNDGATAASLSVEAFTEELRRSGDIRRAWNLANAAVRAFNQSLAETQDVNGARRVARDLIANPSPPGPTPQGDGSAACAVSFSVISPSRPGGPFVLQTHFAGDASVRVFRRGPDGRYRRIFATVEENLGTASVDARQSAGEDLNRTQEISLHRLANTVTNSVGINEELHLNDTARGEIPQEGGRVARAQGYENGLILEEGDFVIAASDGFRENYIDTNEIAEWIQGARSAEEAHRILADETHARMEIVNQLRRGTLPKTANGRFRFTRGGRELFIDRSCNVYDRVDAARPIDKFKPDNFSLAVYRHDVPREAAPVEPQRPAAEAPPVRPGDTLPPLLPDGPAPRKGPAIPPPIPEAARRTQPATRKAATPPPIPEAARRPGAGAEDPLLATARQRNFRVVGELSGLTEAMETAFLQGTRVLAARQPHLHYVLESRSGRQEVHAETYQIYCRWRELMALGNGGIPAALRELSQQAMRPIAQAILENPETVPVRRVQVGEFGFYLSRVIRVNDPGASTHGYDFVVGVVPEVSEGVTTLKRRFFYRSHSGGGWRASPFMGLGGLMKGQFQIRGNGDLRSTVQIEASRHYTAESEPLPQMLTALDSIDRQGNYISMGDAEIQSFIGLVEGLESSEGTDQSSAIRQSLMGGYGERVAIAETPELSEVQNFAPGEMFRNYYSGDPMADFFPGSVPRPADPNRETPLQRRLAELRDLTYPEGFLPDFHSPELRSYRAPHTILGEVAYREFGGSTIRDRQGRARPLIWTLAEGGRRPDGSTRVWIQSIRFADVPASSYGVPAEVLDSGGLTSKPIEYRNQADLVDGTPFSAELPPSADGASYPQYIDVTPALDVLRPIREYRAARGLAVAEARIAPRVRSPIVVTDAPATSDSPATPAELGDIVGYEGDRPYQILRRGRSTQDRRFVYQMRIEAPGSTGPRLLEVRSPVDLSVAQLREALDGRPPRADISVQEGWGIASLVGEGRAAGRVVRQSLPLGELQAPPESLSTQLDFFFVPTEAAPVTGNPAIARATVVDPLLPRASGSEPTFRLSGLSTPGGSAGREWILQVQQAGVPVYVGRQRVEPFQSFVKLREGSLIRVGVNEFELRGQTLVPVNTMQLRFSVPSPAPGVETLPLAAAVEDPSPPSSPRSRR